jgi:YHS domain-containing protein
MGDQTYCPVSGVVFSVSEASPIREIEGRRLYFCCPACAGHFDKHTDEVLASRGLEIVRN